TSSHTTMSSCRHCRATLVGRRWTRALRHRFKPSQTASRRSSTGWACGRGPLPGNPPGGGWGVGLAGGGGAGARGCFRPPGAGRSQRSIELRAAGVRRSVGALSRYSSRADAMATNALLRWLLLAGQVAHPNRVPPEALAAYIRASGAAPVVAPLLQAIPLRQV